MIGLRPWLLSRVLAFLNWSKGNHQNSNMVGKEKLGIGGGAVLPPKLARAFNAYLIGTSVQRLPNWHERLTLTWLAPVFNAYPFGRSVQRFQNLDVHLTLRKRKKSNAYPNKIKTTSPKKCWNIPAPKKEKKLKMHWSYFATPRVLHIPAVAVFFISNTGSGLTFNCGEIIPTYQISTS